MQHWVAGGALAVLLLLAGCSATDTDDDSEDAPTTGGESTATSGETTTSAPTPTAHDADPDETAAMAFIEAWRRGDAQAMGQLAADEQVDIALSHGTANGEPDCTSQPSGQYQCVVNVSTGTRAYILVGEPGDRTGRVWWVAEYVPGT